MIESQWLASIELPQKKMDNQLRDIYNQDWRKFMKAIRKKYSKEFKLEAIRDPEDDG